MRTKVCKHIDDVDEFKKKLVFWANNSNECIVLNSNRDDNKDQLYPTYDFVVAIDAFTSVKTDYQNAFKDLYEYQSRVGDFIFGYLSYDLKNDTEILSSNNFDGLHFPELFFFQPKKIFNIIDNSLEMNYLNMCDDEFEKDYYAILSQKVLPQENKIKSDIKARVNKSDYISNIEKLLNYIQEGRIYEVNYCMEFYAENYELNPIEKYLQLNEISSPPFATYFKFDQKYLISASPERFLKKNGVKIISQPIKGTAKRSNDLVKDAKIKAQLATDFKEISENTMIVDLVRNDLSQNATKGSVKVEEFCKVYSFKQVHQMISTITSEVDFTANPIQVIRNCFPMGSMTGAPKISAMKIIEEVEVTKRGLYSGAIGYFTPNNDFDFNVVIRSILYNDKNKYLSFSVGSAITSLSIPDKEYEECLLKAKAIFEIL